MNKSNVGTYLRMAKSEFQTDGLTSTELIRWCTFGQLGVISVLVIVAIVEEITFDRLREQSKQINKTGPTTQPCGTPYM